MAQGISLASFCLAISLFSAQANACANHFYFNPDNAGFFTGALIKMAGLAPPEQVFKVKHPPLSAVVIGEDSVITIDYDRPWFSKGVSMRFTGSRNVEMLDEDIVLTDYQGTVSACFRLNGRSFDGITVTVSGEHKGEVLSYTSRVHVMAKNTVSSQDRQVTSR